MRNKLSNVYEFSMAGAALAKSEIKPTLLNVAQADRAKINLLGKYLM